MKCEKCGREYLDGLDYCIYCDGVESEKEKTEGESAAEELEGVLPTEGDTKDVRDLLQEDEDAEPKKSAKDSVKEIGSKTREFLLNHKKGVRAAVAAAAVLGGVVLCFRYVPVCNGMYLNMKGTFLIKIDPYEAREVFRQAYDKGSIRALKGMIQSSLELGDIESAKSDIDHGMWDYPNDSRLEEVLDSFRPESPTADLAEGTYTEVQTVHLQAGEGEYIYYMDEEEYIPYQEEGIFLNQKGEYHLEAYAKNELNLSSQKTELVYNMDIPAPGIVKANLEDGVYTELVTLELTADDGCEIYYDLTGGEPDQTDTKYTEGILLQQGQNTVTAVAFNADGTRGEVYRGMIELQLPIPNPVQFSLEGGLYWDDLSLELTQDQEAEIYYTTDGSEPDQNSILYTAPITITSGGATIKAVALNQYGQYSDILTEEYEVTYEKSTWMSGTFGYTVGGFVYYSKENAIYQCSRDLEQQDVLTEGELIGLHSSGLYFTRKDGDTLGLFRIEPKTGEVSERIAEVSDYRDFRLANDSIYCLSTKRNQLYQMELDGTRRKIVYENPNLEMMSSQHDKLWFVDIGDGDYSGKFYCMNEKNGEPVFLYESDEARSGICPQVYSNENKEYYMMGGNVYVRDSEGIRTLLERSEYDYVVQEPTLFREGIQKRGGTSYHFSYRCHNSLYVKKSVSTTETTTDWLGNESRESKTENTWLCIDIDTEEIKTSTMKAEDVIFLDDMLLGYDGSIVRTTH